jgi:hypothetical protein
MGLIYSTFQFEATAPTFETVRRTMETIGEVSVGVENQKGDASAILSLEDPNQSVGLVRTSDSVRVECMLYAHWGLAFRALRELGGTYPDWDSATQACDFGESFLGICAEGDDLQFESDGECFILWSCFLDEISDQSSDPTIWKPVQDLKELLWHYTDEPVAIPASLLSSIQNAIRATLLSTQTEFGFDETPRVLSALAKFLKGKELERVTIVEL